MENSELIDSIPFAFDAEAVTFEKSDASPNRMRRIAGVISTEVKDRQGDTVLQRGLDFSEFLQFGWFNDNHSRETAAVLGYPDTVRQFRKGDILPDGRSASSHCTWAEGYLLNTQKADEIWELGQALRDTPRRLGYSVEGKIESRTGSDRKTIAKAVVREVAITKSPVNTDSRLEVLAKAIIDFEKALSVGPVSDPGAAPTGPQTGEGAGQVLTVESLETDEKIAKMVLTELEEDEKSHINKSFSELDALAWVRARMPNATLAQCGRFVDLTLKLKGLGRI